MRFKEFSGEWEKGKLNNFVDFLKGNGVAKTDLSNEGHPCVLYGQLYTTYKNEVLNDIVSYTNIKSNNLVYSLPNDVIIPASGETPEDIATARCIIKDNVIIGGDLNILRPKNHSGIFLSYQLNGKRKYDIAKVAVGKSIVHLHNENLSNIVVYFPIYNKEEIKIVELLRLIDNRIETQMKIIEEYKSLIKGIRDKLIYKNKSLNKVIKIKDIADCLGGYAFDSSTYVKRGKYKVITIGNVTGDEYINISNTNFIDTLPNDIHKYQILKKESILISLTGNVGRVSKVLFENCLLNQRVATLMVKKYNLQDYIYYCLSSIIFENSMIKCSQGAAQKNINNADIESFNIPFTDNINYIVMICNVIKKFDLLLSSNKKILENYFKFKKYLLNNMFI